MLCELSVWFAEVRDSFEAADRVLAQRLPSRLSSYVFPPPRFSAEEQQARQQALTQTNVAQPALGAASMGLLRLLRVLGIEPDMVAGHSYGEYVALAAAGALSEDVLYSLSEARGRCIIDAAGQDLGTMAAVAEGRERIVEILKPVADVWIANINAPRQTVISGTRHGIEQAIAALGKEGIEVRPFPIACAFHSPLIAPAKERLANVLSTVDFRAPRIKVFSNTSAAGYPDDPKAFATVLAEQLVSPVQFAQEVEAIYQDGARIFLEVGPRNVLTGLAQQILANRPCLTVALEGAGRSGLVQLHHALGQLAAHGVPLKLDRFFQDRAVRRLNLKGLEEETREKAPALTTWLVSGGSAKPLREAATREERQRKPVQKETTGNGKVEAPPSSSAKPTKSPATAAAKADVPSALPTPEVKPQPVVPPPRPQAPIALARPQIASVVPLSPQRGEGSGQVMLQFQQLMNRFLETQQQVMLAYLRGAPDGTAQSPERLPSVPLQNRAADHPTPAHQPPLPAKIESPQAAAAASPKQDLPPSEHPLPPRPIEVSGPTDPVPVQESEPVINNRQLTKQLLEIVSDRTGYPSEMLGLDLNIEADLGIDSIKRVEILGAFLRGCLPSGQQKTQEAMEKLTGIKTLRGIVDSIGNILQPQPMGETKKQPSKPLEVPVTQTPEPEVNGKAEISRFLLAAANARLTGQSPVSIPGDKVFVITDDERGVAGALAEVIRRHGGRTAIVRLSSEDVQTDQDIYTANLTDPAIAADLLAIIQRRQGPIAGIIHLLPLRAGPKFDEMDLAGWRGRLGLEVKSLFNLAKGGAAELKRAGESGGGWLCAATAMGGNFASGTEAPPSFFPGQGGIAGFIKTVAVEWPTVQCKIVDLDMEAPPATLAGYLLSELMERDKEVEVGYRDSQRFVLRAKPAPLARTGLALLKIDSNWVVLVTGGARGITAEIASELAARYRPTLLLLGRSPLPEKSETPETASLTSPKAIKAILMEQMRQGGQTVTPAQVEAACSSLLRDREMRRNLAAMDQAGASVRYYQVDVRDERALGSLMDGIYQEYGKIDGVIHGAGIIEDKLVEDKNPDSFDRVLDTKAASAFILSRKLRPDSLKFLVFFSSVAGRFGNRGQSDYAAANEVLNKLAVSLDRQWPGRVLAINWGPWGKTGMASAEVQNQFAQRGVQLIPPPAGCRMLDEELRFGQKGQSEVIIGDGPWERLEAASGSATAPSLPLLNGVPARQDLGGATEIVWKLDPVRDRYLQDHRLDGQPVFPMAMAVELMAEVVQRGWPQWKVIGIRSLRVLRGIVLAEGAREVRVTARAEPRVSNKGEALEIDVQISELGQQSHPCYRATVQIAEEFPKPPPLDGEILPDLRPFPMGVEESYERWLFHGPCFQGISAIEGMNEQGICGILIPSSPAECLSPKATGRWLIDPVLLDCGFQLAILWERAHHDMTPLPSRFSAYRQFGSASTLSVRCCLRAQSSTGGQNLLTDVFFLDEAGRLLGLLEQMEFSCSTALNRLAGLVMSNRGDR
ncbi:MAG: SDR family NAD(P)-dependent oxidoreductase [Verrucomicrobiales bacterium]|nr:SDR family NAD(P)-dependent oxidoreductase [Verrucomicrobiales bacterium]